MRTICLLGEAVEIDPRLSTNGNPSSSSWQATLGPYRAKVTQWKWATGYENFSFELEAFGAPIIHRESSVEDLPTALDKIHSALRAYLRQKAFVESTFGPGTKG